MAVPIRSWKQLCKYVFGMTWKRLLRRKNTFFGPFRAPCQTLSRARKEPANIESLLFCGIPVAWMASEGALQPVPHRWPSHGFDSVRIQDPLWFKSFQKSASTRWLCTAAQAPGASLTYWSIKVDYTHNERCCVDASSVVQAVQSVLEGASKEVVAE